MSLLGAGSLLFQLMCPAYVKRYGDAHEFVDREEKITSERRKEDFIRIVLTDYIPRISNGKYTFDDFRGMQFTATDQGRVTSVGLKNRTLMAEDLELVKGIAQVYSEYLKGEPRLVMADYFVPLKSARPIWRLVVSILYGAGFLILAVPAVDTFLLVLSTLF